MRTGIKNGFSALVLIVVLAMPLHSAFAATSGVRFTLTIKSAFAHTAPNAAEAPADFFQPDAPVIPAVSQTARDIYARGLAMGNNPRAFSKVGDCQSVVPYFLAAFDYGPNMYNLGPYTDLQPTIDNFA